MTESAEQPLEVSETIEPVKPEKHDVKVVLNDGTEHIGKLVEECDKSVTLETEYGSVTVNKAKGSLKQYNDSAADEIGTMRVREGSTYIKAEPDVWRLLQRGEYEPNPHTQLPDKYMTDAAASDDTVQTLFAGKQPQTTQKSPGDPTII